MPEKVVHYAHKGHLVEMINDSEKGFQLVHRTPEGKMERSNQLEFGQKTLVGRTDSFIKNGTVLLPPPPHENLQDPCSLFLDIVAFLEKHVTWSGSFLIGAGAFVMSSWVYHRFDFFPALQFTGHPGSGKTVSLRVLREVCYHGAKFSSPTPAILYRAAEAYHPTLLIDEMDKELSSDIRAILREGSNRDGCITRCSPETFEPQSFRCYGPKVYAGQQPIHDAALSTRIINENMTLNRPAKHIGSSLPSTFVPEAELLRSRLLRWSMDNYWVLKPSVPPLVDLRQQQVFIPLFTVTPEEFHGELLSLASRQRKTLRNVIEGTLDGEVVAAIVALGRPEMIRPIEIAGQVNKMRGLDPDKELRHPDLVTARKIHEPLMRIGIDPTWKDRGEHGVIYRCSKDVLERICKSHGADDEPAELAS